MTQKILAYSITVLTAVFIMAFMPEAVEHSARVVQAAAQQATTVLPQQKTTAVVAVPQFNDARKLKIRDIQFQIQNTQIQMDKLAADWEHLLQIKQAAGAQLTTVVTEGYAEVGVTADDCTLDFDTLVITARPKKAVK
jgi:hypothetical protein